MQTKPVIMTSHHKDGNDVWTERTRWASRDEAINEGRALLDMDKNVRQFEVESWELREGKWETFMTYRETSWRPCS